MTEVLIFCSREICYLSGNFFANQIGAAFEELGIGAKVCELSEERSLEEQLEPLIGPEYRLILDFNSRLPRMVMEDGRPYLDRLNGPFFDYILDHPLFHYNGLTTETENMRVIVPDEAHAAYVRRYHPQIKSVHMLPLGGTRALSARGSDKAAEGQEKTGTAKSCRVFFPGTFDTPDAVYRLVQEASGPVKRAMQELIDMRLAEPLLPMEEAYERYLAGRQITLSDGEFALSMNAMYPVDAYIRDSFRKAAVDALLSARIPVTVMGEGWEKYHAPDERCLKRERGVLFGLSFERIAREEILLNVAPIFNRGMHDRIVAGMANETVVLTDENPYLRRRFPDKETLAFYSLRDMDTLCDTAARLMEDGARRERMARRAYHEFLAHDTWKCRARQILEWTGRGEEGTACGTGVSAVQEGGGR